MLVSDRDASSAGQDEPVPAPAPVATSFALSWQLLRSITRYSRREVAVVIALTLASGAASGVGLLMLVPLLGLTGLDVGQGSVGRLADVMAGAFASIGVVPTVPVVLLLYLGVVTVQALLQRATAIRSVLLYQGYVRALRRRVYAAIVRSSWLFFARHRSADFTHALTQEVERVGGVSQSLVGLVSRLIQTAIYLALALFVSPWATLVAVASGVALSALLARATEAGRAKGEEVSKAYESLFATIAEHLAGMRVSKSHATEAEHQARFAERTDATAGSMAAVARHQAALSVSLQIGSAAILAAVFWFALEVLSLPLAGILLLLYVFARLVPLVTGLQRQVVGIVQRLPAFERIEDLVKRFRGAAEAIGEAKPMALQSAIRLERVGFRYDEGAAVPPLSDVDLVFPAGTTTAIVGPSGAGKSTLADLLVGLVMPTSGRVTVDGATLEGSAVAAWRRSIGYVHQDTFLFHDTIRENLRLVRREATDDEIDEALRAAAAEFVYRLPEGLDTVLGDRGVRLSGGERQRVALARALLRRPALLVLDEATSSLDAESEAAIQQALERMSGQRTIVVIAHRLSTVRNADVIHVVEAGRVVQSGTWAALLADRHGRFRALCEAQGIVTPVAADAAPVAPERA